MESMSPPHAGEAGHSRLAPGALAYLNVRDGSAGLIAGLAASVGVSFVSDPAWRTTLWLLIAGLVGASLAIELPWLNRREVASTSYTATPSFVYIARGWIWRRSIVVPTARILNVEIVQGPLLRAFGLTSVRLMSVVELDRIGPLSRDEAERMRATVLSSHSEPLDG